MNSYNKYLEKYLNTEISADKWNAISEENRKIILSDYQLEKIKKQFSEIVDIGHIYRLFLNDSCAYIYPTIDEWFLFYARVELGITILEKESDEILRNAYKKKIFIQKDQRIFFYTPLMKCDGFEGLLEEIKKTIFIRDKMLNLHE